MTLTKTMVSAVVVLLFVTLVLAFSPKLSTSTKVPVASISDDMETKDSNPVNLKESQGKKLGIGATFAVIVNDVQPGTLASEVNLTSGDFILDVNGKQFFSLREFQGLIETSARPLKLRVLRLNESCQNEVFEVHLRGE